MDSRRRRGRDIQAAIAQVLEECWDPIDIFPGGPSGEYDSYIGPIYRLLADGAGEIALLRYLMETEDALLGVPSRVTPRIAETARRLLALDVSIESEQ